MYEESGGRQQYAKRHPVAVTPSPSAKAKDSKKDEDDKAKQETKAISSLSHLPNPHRSQLQRQPRLQGNKPPQLRLRAPPKTMMTTMAEMTTMTEVTCKIPPVKTFS